MYPPLHSFKFYPSPAARTAQRQAACFVFTLLILTVSGCDQSSPVDSISETDRVNLDIESGLLTSEVIQLPAAPRALTGVGDLNFEPPVRGGGRNHGKEPAGLWLQRLRRADSWDLAVLFAANAGQAIMMMPPRAQRPLSQRLMQTFRGVSYLADLVERPPEPPRQEILDLLGDRYQDGIYTLCFVGFDDYATLDAIPDQAATTFTYSPYWRQNCGDAGQVRVEPATPYHNHFHLNFEDPTIDCTDPDEGFVFGREVDGECEALSDFAAEPRYLGTHLGDEIVRITAHTPFIGSPMPFDLISFQNTSDVPVKVRYMTESGDWYQFDSLGGPANWGVSIYDAMEVLITHEGTSLDCGPDVEAGAPGGCEVDYTRYFVDEFVIGL